MNAKELKEKLNELVALVPEMNGKGFDEKVKIENIIDYLKDSLEAWNNSIKDNNSESETKRLEKDNKFFKEQLEKKNKEIVELNKVITEQESVYKGNPNVNNDNEELLLAYGVNQNTSELEKINTGFEILIRRAGKERVKVFVDAAMGNLTQFAHDEKATLNYMKEKLHTAMEKLGFEKVEGKLRIAQKESLKK